MSDPAMVAERTTFVAAEMLEVCFLGAIVGPPMWDNALATLDATQRSPLDAAEDERLSDRYPVGTKHTGGAQGHRQNLTWRT